jgi:putative aldouronate transport system substrate-binding protein
MYIFFMEDNHMKRFTVVSVMLILGAALAFAGGQGASGRAGGLTTIQMTHVGTSAIGIQEGYYWTDILKEDLGIQLDLVASTPDNIKAMMAARDLPELVVTNQGNEIGTAIQAGMFINLDDYRDKLPNLFANGGQGMLQYHRDNFSNGTGQLNAIRFGATNQSGTRGQNNASPYLRWDYYKELGMPAINSLENYLPLLKAMADRHPVNEEGQKVYGISLWPNWDEGRTMFAVNGGLAPLAGIITIGTSFLELDLQTSALTSFMDDNSFYKRGLEFLFTANQMGLLDPDSITQTWDNFTEKATAGRILFAFWPWGTGSFNTADRAEQVVGFKMVPFEGQKILGAVSPVYLGGQCFLAVNKNHQNLDKILEFINYVFDYDSAMKLSLGPKGITWDVDSAGEPYVTELGWKMRTESLEFPNGGKLGSGYSWATNETPLNGRNIHPVYKRSIGGSDWIRKDFAPKDTPLQADWKKIMNAEDDIDYMIKNNMILEEPFAGLPSVPNDIQALILRVGTVIQPGSWQAVFARNEAEFNAIWTKMQADAKGLGIDRVNEWFANAHNKARAEGAKYMR